MEDMESKMGAILNNPDMMQKIMAMAQSLNLGNSPPTPHPDKIQENQPPVSQPLPGIPNIDLSILQKISGFATQSRIDNDQQALLKALTPYLSRERISKLERAMRAVKMAGLASTLLQSTGFQSLFGR